MHSFLHSHSLVEAVGVHLLLELSLLLLNLSDKALIKLFLLKTHLLRLFALLLGLLLFEEFYCIVVDFLYLCLNSLILFFPEITFLCPHGGLLVKVFSNIFLTLLLVILLLSQSSVDNSLSICLLLSLGFFLLAELDFSFTLVPENHLFFLLSIVAHLFKNSSSHAVHEFLCSLFTSCKFVGTVLFLLLQHADVSFLGSDIFKTLLFFVFSSNLLVLLVLLNHFQEVCLFLSLLLFSNLAFFLNFILNTFQHGSLLSCTLSLFLSSFMLEALKLFISLFLFNLDFVPNCLLLIGFFLVKELAVLFELPVIGTIFFHLCKNFSLFSFLLGFKLDHQEAFTLFSTGSCLLLLLKM